MADSRIAAVEATDAATEPDTHLSSTRTANDLPPEGEETEAASAVAYVPNAQFRRVVVGELKESMHPSGRKHAVRASIDSSGFSRIRYVVVEQDLDGKSLPIPASTRRTSGNGIDTEGPITVSFPFHYTFKGSDRAEAVRKQVLEEYSKQLVSLKDGTRPPVQYGVQIWLALQDGHQYRFYDPEFSSVLLYQFLLVSSEKMSDRKLEAQIALKARVTDLASLPTDVSEAAYISDEEVLGICSCGEPDEGITIQCDGAKCSIKWYHLGCAGLTKVPPVSKKWYCSNCSKGKKSKM
ncbi:hypothetical protein LTS18_010464 [Coniosporium uncinatum]|uniref:Uncharacterized protein n=1 Tax=Coniosporium uncinatum TaxID=93489 RepID=A0ACC3DWA5_9PEZI|nr:hypothetical protein LTS18_010464 [Coniosporium uncinatum]